MGWGDQRAPYASPGNAKKSIYTPMAHKSPLWRCNRVYFGHPTLRKPWGTLVVPTKCLKFPGAHTIITWCQRSFFRQLISSDLVIESNSHSCVEFVSWAPFAKYNGYVLPNTTYKVKLLEMFTLIVRMFFSFWYIL